MQVLVELVDADNGELIWAEKYTREQGDLFTMNAELARDIAGAVEPETAGHAYLLSKRKTPDTITAWDLVLQGNHELFLQMGTQWSSRKARALYQRALKLDPDYAPAYSGYAYSLCLDLKEDICPDRDVVTRRMYEMAEHGVTLDASNPFCHVVLGRAYHQQQEYQAALANYRQAVELCPSSAKARFGLGFGLAATGKYDEAISEISRAQVLSPRDPFSWVFHTVKALSHMYAERFDDAEAAAGISSAYPKANHWASLVHVSSLVQTGRFNDALSVLQKARGKRPDITAHSFDNAFPVAGDVDPRSITDGLREAGLPKG
jgi:adenylate cyclase